jgi:hypothetical protein
MPRDVTLSRVEILSRLAQAYLRNGGWLSTDSDFSAASRATASPVGEQAPRFNNGMVNLIARVAALDAVQETLAKNLELIDRQRGATQEEIDRVRRHIAWNIDATFGLLGDDHGAEPIQERDSSKTKPVEPTERKPTSFAASQARFLMLTARKSDLELQGQFINQARLQVENMRQQLITLIHRARG